MLVKGPLSPGGGTRSENRWGGGGGGNRWPLKIGPKKIEGKMEFGAKKIELCKDWEF